MITKTIIFKFLCKDVTHDTTSADITTETTDETAEHEEENESETGNILILSNLYFVTKKGLQHFE